MDLIDEDTHRLLAYVDAARSGGHLLTRKQFDAFANQPDRQQMYSLIRAAAIGIDKLHSPRWLESATAWFERLGWVTRTIGTVETVQLTSLGRALLKHLDSPRLARLDDGTIEVFLDPDDPMSYVRLVGALVDLGEDVLLIDPYVRFPELNDLVGSSVCRILTTRKTGTQAILQLQLALGVIPPEQRPEIRITSGLHDRFAISQEGRVIALGSSVGSSRKNIGAVVELHAQASDAIRAAHEKLWKEAEELAPRPPANGSQSASAAPAATSASDDDATKSD